MQVSKRPFFLLLAVLYYILHSPGIYSKQRPTRCRGTTSIFVLQLHCWWCNVLTGRSAKLLPTGYDFHASRPSSPRSNMEQVESKLSGQPHHPQYSLQIRLRWMKQRKRNGWQLQLLEETAVVIDSCASTKVRAFQVATINYQGSNK